MGQKVYLKDDTVSRGWFFLVFLKICGDRQKKIEYSKQQPKAELQKVTNQRQMNVLVDEDDNDTT